MQHSKFQESEPSGYEEEFFYIVRCISIVQIQDPLRRGNLDPGTFIWTNLTKRTIKQCFKPNIKHLSQVVRISKVQIQDPFDQGYFGLWDLYLNKLGKGQLGTAA